MTFEITSLLEFNHVRLKSKVDAIKQYPNRIRGGPSIRGSHSRHIGCRFYHEQSTESKSWCNRAVRWYAIAIFQQLTIKPNTLRGTTRDNFGDKPVVHLAYEAYAPLAIKTMAKIARQIKDKHGLNGVAMIHRLGVVPIAEESILIAVSSPHRQAAWRAGEEALELTKEKVEVWKLEEFGGEEGGVWRANRDGQAGVKISN